MKRLRTHLDPARRSRPQDERGYVLLTVLVATMIFGLIVVALLSMVQTDARVQPTYINSDKVKRALDGGLQTGIARIKAVPTAALSASTDPCVGMDGANGIEIEGRTVDVSCVNRADAAPIWVPTTGEGGTALSVTGRWPARSDLKEQLMRPTWSGGGGFSENWADGLLDALGVVESNTPGLFALGPNPPTVHGDVAVKHWFLGATPKANRSALEVRGSFQQGDNKEKACNLLKEWTIKPLGVSIPLGFIGNVEATGAKNCASPPADSEFDRPDTDGLAVRTLDAAACVDGKVLALEPGRYGPDAVAVLNQWLAPGPCQNAVLWFQPGIYRFDAGGTLTMANLAIADPSMQLVFGTWAGAATWTPFTLGAPHCDPDSAGVSVTLGATTRIAHTAGRISMCGDPATNASPTPVLTQLDPPATMDASGTFRWAVDSTSAERCTRVNGEVDCTAPIPVPEITATTGVAPVGFPAGGDGWDNSEATRVWDRIGCDGPCYPVWRMSGWGPINPTGEDAPLSTAEIHLRGAYTDLNVLDGNTKFFADVTLADGTNCISGVGNKVPSINNTAGDLVINLLNKGYGCGALIDSADDLVGASIQIRGAMTGSGNGNFRLDYVWLEFATRVPRDHEVRMDRAGGTSFTAHGVVYLPTSFLRVIWADTAAPALGTDLPVVIGQLAAASVLSATGEGSSWRVGSLASRSIAAVGRSVTLQASIDGRLLASADVTINDWDVSTFSIAAARGLETANWAYCNKELTPTATCSTP